MRFLGVILCFNEADCVGHAIRCLLNSGHDVHVFDHGSNRATRAALATFADWIKIHRMSRRWAFPSLFPGVSRFVRQKGREGYGWVTWLDADEILRPPDRSNLTREHMVYASRRFDVVRPLLREFWLTPKDDPKVADVRKRQIYFIDRPPNNCPRSWRIALTGTMPFGLHRKPGHWRPGARISHNEWFLDHYPIRSREQGRRKVMKDRPRGDVYQKYRRVGCRNLIKPAHKLRRLRRDGRDVL